MEIKRYRIASVGAQTPNVLSKVIHALSVQNYEIDTVSPLRVDHSTVVICIVKGPQSKKKGG